MADVPINIVNLSVPFEDEPGSSAPGSSGVDMKPLLDAMRSMGVSVSAINQNVRSILETLRKISLKSGGMAGGVKVVRASQSERVTGSKVVHIDPRKQIVPYQPSMTPNFRWTPSPVEEPRRAARSRGGLAPISTQAGPMIEGDSSPISSVSDDEARRRAAFSEWQRDYLRRLASRTLPGPSGVPAGRFRPPPPPDARGGTVMPPPPPDARGSGFRPPPPPDAPRRRAGGGGIMDIITGIGRILSVMRLLGSMIAGIFKTLAALPKWLADQRKQLSRVDPVIATQEAQAMISALQADIAVAQDPRTRGALGRFTQSQIAFNQAMIPVRIAAIEAASVVGTQTMYAATGMAQILSGNFSQGVPLLSAVFGSIMGWLPPGLAALISSVQTAQFRASVNGMFLKDFESMTMGAFSPTRAYPGNRNAGNWWR